MLNNPTVRTIFHRVSDTELITEDRPKYLTFVYPIISSEPPYDRHPAWWSYKYEPGKIIYWRKEGTKQQIDDSVQFLREYYAEHGIEVIER